MTHKPFVPMQLKIDKFGGWKFGEVHFARFDGIVNDAVDAAVGAVGEGFLLVAGDAIVPVVDEETAVGSVLGIEAAVPSVWAVDELFFAGAFETGSVAFEAFAAHAVHVDIIEKEVVSKVGWECVPEVDHGAAVGSFFVAAPRDGLDIGVGVWVGMGTGLTEVASAFHGMPEVGYDAGFEERFALIVPIDAPLIAASLGPQLEAAVEGVESPDSGVDEGAFLFGIGGFANE